LSWSHIEKREIHVAMEAKTPGSAGYFGGGVPETMMTAEPRREPEPDAGGVSPSSAKRFMMAFTDISGITSAPV
jgi:hypothetical protein